MIQPPKVSLVKSPFDDDAAAVTQKDRARLRCAALDLAVRATEARDPARVLQAAKDMHAWITEDLSSFNKAQTQ
jgi:hypothetical protein